MKSLVQLVRAASPTVRLLTINQFGINVGFYMFIPYLTVYLTGSLGLAAATVGVILGVRNLSQQGMFLVGGTLADRYGFRALIIAGCLLRVVAFGILAVATTVPVLISASLLTGLAGALFNPAVRAYVAAEAEGHASDAFALFNIGYQAGILAGPLLGLALITVDFRLAAATSAAVFAALTAAQLRWLPPRQPDHQDQPGVLAEWRMVLANLPFRRFTLWMSLSYALSFQVYLALPLALTAALGAGFGTTTATAVLFGLSGLISLVGQAPIHRYCKRLPEGGPLVAGVLVMAVAFLPPAFAVDLAPPVRVGAVLASAVLLTLGTLIAFPFEMHTIVSLAAGRQVATYYGLNQTVAGIIIATGTAFTGQAFDTALAIGQPAWPWLGLATLGVIAAAGLRRCSFAASPQRPQRSLPQPSSLS